MQNSTYEFLKPRQIDVDALSATRAKVFMEPFERGFGYTLGNALRRISSTFNQSTSSATKQIPWFNRHGSALSSTLLRFNF